MDTAIRLLTYLLFGLALWISNAPSLRRMVNVYIWQAITLTAITFLTAIELWDSARGSISVGLLSLIPLLLAGLVKPFLARATVTGEFSLRQMLEKEIRREVIREAEQIWIEHGGSRLGRVANIFVNLGLTIFAFIIAFGLIPFAEVTALFNLAMSLGLLLIGLLTMIVKTDIISQVMGLLVVEHGMFLTAIRVITIPSLRAIFVFSMVFYILITLFILLYLLPKLHLASGSIEIEDINQESDLRG